MKLIEALEIIRQNPRAESQRFRASLVCGFTPLHLQTFLQANLVVSLPERRIELQTGLYGDFWGNLDRLDNSDSDVGVIVMEWSDLDPRLGLRSLGSWAPDAFDDILRNIRGRARQFQEAIARFAPGPPLVISFPTLPFPPVSYTPGWRTSELEAAVSLEIATLCAELARFRNVGILNAQRLSEVSPLASRFDARSELITGFPYKMGHASALADMFAKTIQPPPAKKGLITDLDDTLWSGILGEVGVEGVSWSLELNSHMHGVYQRFLHSLERAGVLVAAASKNDPNLVDRAFGRNDILLSQANVFPIEANWGPKSESVGKILKSWNVGEESVVFVDDSPMELAEVRSVHPNVECLLFPKEDPQAIETLLSRLRDLFGKNSLSDEDAIRRDSIRRVREAGTGDAAGGQVSEEFLRQADAELTFQFVKDPPDPRALELVNKTNQFNLNGRRLGEREWQDFLSESSSMLMVASYKDKFGPLGKIAVLAGRLDGRRLTLPVWVMSCRAFSRRIEHRCLEELFARFNLDEIVFDFNLTPRNGPVREFLASMLGQEPFPGCKLSRQDYCERKQETYQRVLELTNG